MKLAQKYLFIVPLLVFLCLGSCKKDDESSSEDDNGGEQQDLSQLEMDTEFIAYANSLYDITLNTIQDYETFQRIVENNTSIPDSERENLALAIGFENVQAYNDYIDEQVKLASSIIKKYNLKDREEDVFEIYTEVLLTIIESNGPDLGKSQKMVKNDELPEECKQLKTECEIRRSVEMFNIREERKELVDIFCDSVVDGATVQEYRSCIEYFHSLYLFEYDIIRGSFCSCISSDLCGWPGDDFPYCNN